MPELVLGYNPEEVLPTPQSIGEVLKKTVVLKEHGNSIRWAGPMIFNDRTSTTISLTNLSLVTSPGVYYHTDLELNNGDTTEKWELRDPGYSIPSLLFRLTHFEINKTPGVFKPCLGMFEDGSLLDLGQYQKMVKKIMKTGTLSALMDDNLGTYFWFKNRSKDETKSPFRIGNINLKHTIDETERVFHYRPNEAEATSLLGCLLKFRDIVETTYPFPVVKFKTVRFDPETLLPVLPGPWPSEEVIKATRKPVNVEERLRGIPRISNERTSPRVTIK